MKRLAQTILVVIVLAAAVAFARHLILTRKKAQRVERGPDSTLVEVIEVRASDETVVVPAMGTVRPSREVTLFPEVTGRIVEQNARLEPGACLPAGETVARIDRAEYDMAVEQQKAAVEKARFDLKLEEGRQIVAQREWKLMGKEAGASEELALRRPHLANARAALDGAQSGLDRAELNVKRTMIRAPFNALVIEEFVDVGQVVTPQTKIARLVGKDRFWVQASVPLDRLRWLKLPDAEGKGGSSATILHDLGNGKPAVRKGRLARLLGDLDPAGRMARVLVAVDDPLGTSECHGGKAAEFPLLLGSYVRVELEGAQVRGVCEVPRLAVHDGDRAWIMNAEDRLEIRKLQIVWRRTDTVLVESGLSPGERVVVSRIGTPVPGMKLRTEKLERGGRSS